ncbi:hypothetical protein HS088_TW04G00880 [Tripterygium wilfordii]|uniref:Uncharacterized protein n=1 Tax=Tripterygium wilfordii TaxID=458696 RepID=A0A7J7DRL0_TRIWF|nr:hypothetical protein HS088_TW04G00880 [Tripterygium wilfordii]
MAFRGGMTLYSVILLVMLLLFINTSLSLKINISSSTSCNGSVHECVIGSEDSEFLVDSETNRMLRMLLNFQALTEGSKNPTPVNDCGKDKSYHPCLPDPNNPKKSEHCQNVYNRACQ